LFCVLLFVPVVCLCVDAKGGGAGGLSIMQDVSKGD